MRSKSEVIVADTLTRLGISYDYEIRLEPKAIRIDDIAAAELCCGVGNYTVHYFDLAN